VANAKGRLAGGISDFGGQRCDSTDRLRQFDRFTFVSRNSRAVVPSVLKPSQALKKKILSDSISDVTNNSTHAFFTLVAELQDEI
jgi:hypothetical protein